jgi:hypothetical protein
MIENKDDIQTILIMPCLYNMNQFEYGVNSADVNKYATYEDMFKLLYELLPGYRSRFIELLQYKLSFLVVVKEGFIHELTMEKLDKEQYKDLLHKDMEDNIKKTQLKNNKLDTISKSDNEITRLSSLKQDYLDQI